MKRTADLVAAVVATVAKPPMQLTYIKKAVAMYQPIFKLKKDLDRRPRMRFCNGTMIKSTLKAQSRTSNAGKVVKTIRQPPYSLNISEADYVLYPRGEV